MHGSQNLRCPFLVPSRRLCIWKGQLSHFSSLVLEYKCTMIQQNVNNLYISNKLQDSRPVQRDFLVKRSVEWSKLCRTSIRLYYKINLNDHGLSCNLKSSS